MPGDGINISLREIYDTLQEVADNVKDIKPQMSHIEGRLSEAERVIPLAKEAYKIATEQATSTKWLWRTVITAIITGVGSIIVGTILLLIQMAAER